jgi:hypothetical protein
MKVSTAKVFDIDVAVDVPTYQVYFWKGSAQSGYELAGCRNVREALAWAEENAGSDRTYTLYAVVDLGQRRVQARLFGVDPTKHVAGRKADWPGQVYESETSSD